MPIHPKKHGILRRLSPCTPSKQCANASQSRQGAPYSFKLRSPLSPPPLSWSRKRRSALFGAFCVKKPDLDNVAKAILDAMNGIVYMDDSQVVGLSVHKFYAEEDEINIKIFAA